MCLLHGVSFLGYEAVSLENIQLAYRLCMQDLQIKLLTNAYVIKKISISVVFRKNIAFCCVGQIRAVFECIARTFLVFP